VAPILFFILVSLFSLFFLSIVSFVFLFSSFFSISVLLCNVSPLSLFVSFLTSLFPLLLSFLFCPYFFLSLLFSLFVSISFSACSSLILFSLFTPCLSLSSSLCFFYHSLHSKFILSLPFSISLTHNHTISNLSLFSFLQNGATTLSIKGTQHNCIMCYYRALLCTVSRFYCYAECH
jgi:hypothetical protein